MMCARREGRLSIKGKRMSKIKKLSEVENLLLNMSDSCLPYDLSDDQRKLLERRFGQDWFTKLGYKEPEYKRPPLSGHQRLLEKVVLEQNILLPYPLRFSAMEVLFRHYREKYKMARFEDFEWVPYYTMITGCMDNRMYTLFGYKYESWGKHVARVKSGKKKSEK